MKIDQIAYYAHDEKQVAQIKHRFGLYDADWVEDEVEGGVEVSSGLSMIGISKAHLHFNYDLGIELEILTYIDGPHWHLQRPDWLSGKIFLSHIGIHCDPGEQIPLQHSPCIQKMTTHSHTNPYLVERGRTYYYEIYGDHPMYGVDVKYIWRLENEQS